MGFDLSDNAIRRIASRIKKNACSDEHEDQLEGGLADKSHPSDFDKEQLVKGLEVELEHTNKPDLAMEIAMDHLEEIPDYYDHLEEMEEEAEVSEED